MVQSNTSLPEFIFSPNEQKLLDWGYTIYKNRKYKYCDSEILNNSQNNSFIKQLTHRTVESLSNELVSNIIGEVKRLSFEKTSTSKLESVVTQQIGQIENECEKFKELFLKLLKSEMKCHQIMAVQFAALKVLNIIFSNMQFLNKFIFCKETDEIDNSKFKKIEEIIQNFVNVATSPYKKKYVTSVCELERIQSVLHMNYVESIKNLKNIKDVLIHKVREMIFCL